MPPFRISKIPSAPPDAGSKRGREAVEEQQDPTNSVRYEWSTSNCTNLLLHNAHDQPCNQHTRLQCDLSGPAKLDARTISTTFRTTDGPYTDATPRACTCDNIL